MLGLCQREAAGSEATWAGQELAQEV